MTTMRRSKQALLFLLLASISTPTQRLLPCLSRKHEDTSHATKKTEVRTFKTCMNYIPHRIVPVPLLSTRYHCSFTALLTSPVYSSDRIHPFFPDTIFFCPASLRAIPAPERAVRYTEVSNLQTRLKGSFSILRTWEDSWWKDCKGLMSKLAPGFTLFSILRHQQSYCKQNHQGYLTLQPLYTELLLCCW